MKKVKFILWVIVACVMFVTFMSFTMVYGDKTQHKEEPKQESIPIVYDSMPIEVEAEEEKQIFLLTAYCPCYECSGGYGDMTATGKRAVEGRTIAVDTNEIEYGTEVYIENIGYRIAEDCGGLVKGKHIDIYFDSHDEVDAFGKRYAEVEI